MSSRNLLAGNLARRLLIIPVIAIPPNGGSGNLTTPTATTVIPDLMEPQGAEYVEVNPSP